ncbi:SRPBCC family protein [Aeromicrobium sp. Sec7.5]|uniref:SRPBCC family protein n=1 Tax=Aeromicrobium sp. Sec7.5 TaxID=3121276 RepID=UPI002FE4764E
MARPYVAPLVASIDVDASPDRVWRLLEDQRRMSEWSDETWKQAFIGTPLRVGTVSLNLNKRKAAVWPTLSRYREVVPGRRLAFQVIGPGATWSYDLQPNDDGGTVVTETRVLKNNRATFASIATANAMLGGLDGHEAEILAGMHATLERIKAEVERG